MSNRIFQAVWDFGPETRSEMLVLMVLADSADSETASSFPSIKHIARCARMSERTVQMVLQALQSDGWIWIEKRTRANGSQSSNLYTIDLEKLGLNSGFVRRRTARSQTQPEPGRKNCTPSERGAKTAGAFRKNCGDVPRKNCTPITNHINKGANADFQAWLKAGTLLTFEEWLARNRNP